MVDDSGSCLLSKLAPMSMLQGMTGSRLLPAVKGKIEMMKTSLNLGADINSAFNNGSTAVIITALKKAKWNTVA